MNKKRKEIGKIYSTTKYIQIETHIYIYITSLYTLHLHTFTVIQFKEFMISTLELCLWGMEGGEE